MEKTIQSLLKRIFFEFEDKIAIKDQFQIITYKDLDLKSDLVAEYIINRKIINGNIGIYLNNKIENIISIIGILKAQCTFVPLYNNFDSIETLNPELIICDNEYSEYFVKNMKDNNIVNYCNLVKSSGAKIEKTELNYSPDDNIYIYKINNRLIVGKNKSILNLVKWFIEEFNINSNSVSALLAPLESDKFLIELFPFLCSGALINVYNENQLSDQAKNKTNTNDKMEWLVLEQSYYPLVLSENSHNKLLESFNQLKTKLNNSGIKLDELAYKLINQYTNLNYKACFVLNKASELKESLEEKEIFNKEVLPNKTNDVVFLFSGLGAQYLNMGVGLYKSYRQFKSAIDECHEIINSITDIDIRRELFPELFEDDEIKGDERKDKNKGDNSQLLLFVFEFSLAKMLIHLGIKPKMVIGYSFGEYVAAAIAGVFKLKDVLKLIIKRVELVNSLPEGKMLSIPLKKEEVYPLLNDELSLAIDNGVACIVSGTVSAIDQLEISLKGKRIICYKLSNNRAVHSFMMDDILEKYRKEFENITLSAPYLPIISTLTGELVTPTEIVNPKYWINQLRNTVKFAEGVKELIKLNIDTFIEIGPGRDLCNLLSYYLDRNKKLISLIRSEKREFSDEYFLLMNLKKIWFEGIEIKWELLLNDITNNSKILSKEEKLLAWINSNRINFLHIPSQLIKDMAVYSNLENIKNTLSHVFITDDYKTDDIFPIWKSTLESEVEFVYLYGAAETSIINAFHYLSKEDTESNNKIIGKNINGVRFLILNDDMGKCNTEEEGKLYIRTPFRSAGYFDCGKIKEEYFVKNPYSDNPKDLLFATNKVGKILKNGDIEIV